MTRKIQWTYLGEVEYGLALKMQNYLREERISGHIADTVLFLQHPPTITLGKRGSMEDVLLPEEELRKRGIALFKTCRGGKVTFHGPGQLVEYPIISLSDHHLNIARYFYILEETLIILLKKYGLYAHRKQNMPGVWIGEQKIASIGIHLKKWVSIHGVAFNISTDLSYFSFIIPCGSAMPMTSLKLLLGYVPPMQKICAEIMEIFSSLLHISAQFVRIPLQWISE